MTRMKKALYVDLYTYLADAYSNKAKYVIV